MVINRFIKQKYFSCIIMFKWNKLMKGFTVKVKLVILRPLCYIVAELPALCTLRSLAVWVIESPLFQPRVWTRVVWVTRQELWPLQLVSKQPLWMNLTCWLCRSLTLKYLKIIIIITLVTVGKPGLFTLRFQILQ